MIITFIPGYEFYKAIANGRHPYIKKGARFMPLYIEPSYDPLKQYVDMGIV